MKKLATMLISMSVLTACSGLSIDAPHLSEGQRDLRAKIIAMGFSPDEIVERPNDFIVEGDMLISKKSLSSPNGLITPASIRYNRSAIDSQKSANPTLPRHQWATNTIANASPGTITIDLSGISSDPNWTAAVRAAIADYNAIGITTLHLTEMTPGGHIKTKLDATLGSSIIGLSDFPIAGQAGDSIRFNPAFSGAPNYYSASQLEFVATHEVGHTLGLRHTNWQALGESVAPYGANQLYQTPTTDANSVMNGASGGTYWIGFSPYDTIAIRQMFPIQAQVAWSGGLSGPGTLSVTLVPAQPGSSFYYQWSETWCNNGTAPHDCDGSIAYLSSGTNVTSISSYMSPATIWANYSVSVFTIMNGELLSIGNITVLGLGQGSGGGGGV